MNKIPENLKQSKLRGRLVLDKNTVETQGRVEKMWLNSQADKIIGVTCKLGFFGKEKKYLTWEEIDTIGADAILANVNPDRSHLEGLEPGLLAIGSEVWTDAGNKAGLLVDYIFNTKTGAVVSFLYRSNGWRGIVDGLYLLSPATVSNAGNKRVIVGDDSVQTAELFTPGLGKKVNEAAAYLEEDLQKTKEHLKSVGRDGQGWAGDFQDKAQQVKEQAQQKAGEIKEKAQTLATEAQQKAEEIKEKVKEQHQEFKQRSKSDSEADNGAETSNQFQNQITEVTEKAKEMIDGIKSRHDAGGVKKEEEKKTEELPVEIEKPTTEEVTTDETTQDNLTKES